MVFQPIPTPRPAIAPGCRAVRSRHDEGWIISVPTQSGGAEALLLDGEGVSRWLTRVGLNVAVSDVEKAIAIAKKQSN